MAWISRFVDGVDLISLTVMSELEGTTVGLVRTIGLVFWTEIDVWLLPMVIPAEIQVRQVNYNLLHTQTNTAQRY